VYACVLIDRDRNAYIYVCVDRIDSIMCVYVYIYMCVCVESIAIVMCIDRATSYGRFHMCVGD
jgi:hypothetical protein